MKRIITIALAIIPFVGIIAQEYPDYSHGTAIMRSISLGVDATFWSTVRVSN